MYMPRPGVTPLNKPPKTPPARAVELGILRKQTQRFIEANPMNISLVPQLFEEQTDGGAIRKHLSPRPVQKFRLIPQGDGYEYKRGLVGRMHEYEFILLGSWDCTMEENDFWENPITNEFYIVESIVHYNGYERKGRVNYYGENPRSFQDYA